jgi:GAF domain-containing protein
MSGLPGVGFEVLTGPVSDVTTVYRTRRRIDLMYNAAANIGSVLDVEATAQQLADVLVPAFGDLASVDLPGPVLVGDEPVPYASRDRGGLHRVAAKHAHGPWPEALLQPGAQMPHIPDRPEFAGTEKGDHIIASDAEQSRAMLGHDPALVRLLLPDGTRESMGAPLFARGMILGYVLVYRTRDPRPFDDEDARLLREIASRAALSIDNARRYQHEQRTALLLQRSMLPRASTDTAAAETAGMYLPAGGSNRIGGEWFDAIALSSLRVALVTGDVAGHGLQATTTMARLRAAVQTLADLDVDPDEVLTRLDALVQQIATETDEPDSTGATCLYGVYDPVTRICRLASAGHPSPAVVHPDGAVELLELRPGPPLGVGGLPFEVTELHLAPGSVIAMYTSCLTKQQDAVGTRRSGLLANLATACEVGRPLEEAAHDLVASDPCSPRTDDVTVLLARTKAVAPADTVEWELPPDPAAVSAARLNTCRQLTAWGLDELTSSTELIVSELVTDAIRYSTGPVVLRLTRDRILVCEVSDSGNS